MHTRAQNQIADIILWDYCQFVSSFVLLHYQVLDVLCWVYKMHKQVQQRNSEKNIVKGIKVQLKQSEIYTNQNIGVVIGATPTNSRFFLT